MNELLMSSRNLTRKSIEAQSNILLEQAASIANIGQWIYDEVNGKYLYVNTNYASIHGMSADEFLIDSLNEEQDLEDVHPDDRPSLKAAYDKARKDGEQYSIKYRIVLEDGTHRWIHEVGSGLEQKNGKWVKTIGTVQDVTQSIRTEDLLQQYKRISERAEKIANYGHWMWDEVNDVCLHCSEGLARLRGMTVDEYLDQMSLTGNSQYRIYPDDRGKVTKAWEQMRNSGESYSIDYRFKHKDGGIRWVREVGSPEKISKSRKVLTSIGITYDITDQVNKTDELSSSYAIQEAILSNIDSGISMADADGKIVAYNKKFLEINDFPASLMGSGITYEDLIRFNAERGLYGSGEVEETVAKRLEKIFNPSISVEEKSLANGLIIEVKRQFLPDGRLIVTDTDITERKQAEKALQHSEQRYRALFNNAQIGIGRTRLGDGSLMLANEKLAQMFGYQDTDRFINEFNFADHYVNGNKRSELIEQYIQNPRLAYECDLVTRNGSIITVTSHGHLNKEKGYIDFVLLDITDKKKTETELRQKEVGLADAQRIAHVGNWRWDIPTDSLISCSEEYARIHGVGMDDVHEHLSHQMEKIIHPADRERVETAFKEFDDKGEDYEIGYRIVTPGGEVRHVIEIGEIFFDAEGNPKEHVGTIQDITELKRAEERLLHSSKLASLGEMATGIAHEINQPLNVIQMTSDMVLDAALDEDLTEDFIIEKMHRINDQMERVKAIIDHIRTFGRATVEEAGLVSVVDVVSNAIEFIGAQLRLRDIDLIIDLPEYTRPVLGHPTQLEQVVLNLIANARDSIEANGEKTAGHGRIAISVIDDLNMDCILCSVSDTGGGIPEDVLGCIFDPFFTTKPAGKGTGVGLSISSDIIKNMGGNITARNADDGAEFIISLPASSDRSPSMFDH